MGRKRAREREDRELGECGGTVARQMLAIHEQVVTALYITESTRIVTIVTHGTTKDVSRQFPFRMILLTFGTGTLSGPFLPLYFVVLCQKKGSVCIVWSIWVCIVQ